MQVKLVAEEGLKKEFHVLVIQEDVSKAIDENLKKISKEVKLQGFRPGKVPISVVRQRYIKNVMDDVFDDMVQKTSQQLMQDYNLRPALQPSVKVVNFAEGKDLEYQIAIEVLPQVIVPDFAKITIPRIVCELTEQDVDNYLNNLAKTRKKIISSAKEFSEIGDTLEIDYVGKVDNEIFQGGSATSHKLELGSKSFIEGFEDQLVGCKVGEKKLVKVRFPDNYHVKNLSGKSAEFDVEVKSILEAQDLIQNDEFAKEFGLETLDDLRSKIKAQMDNDVKQAAKEKTKKILFDKLETLCLYDVPEGMITNEFNNLWSKFLENKERNVNYTKGKTEQELELMYKRLSKRRVVLGLLLAEISNVNKIVADTESIRQAVVNQARNYPGQENMVIEFYQKNPKALEHLKGPIIENKSVDFILQQVQYEDKLVNLESFYQEVQINEDEF